MFKSLLKSLKETIEDSIEESLENIIQGNENPWHMEYNWNKSSVFSVDYREKCSGRYSFKLENKDLNDAYIEKTFTLKSNTRYRIRAMVKYEGFVTNPKESSSGASIGIAASYEHSSYCTSDEWTALEYSFDTGNKTSVTLCLRNGMYGGTCKGTAWFSDVKLEEDISTQSNEWNILAVVFQSVDAYATIKDTKQKYKGTLGDKDVVYLTGILNSLYQSFESISGGLMKVKNIDVVATQNPVTYLVPSYNGLDQNHISVSKTLDFYLSQGTYNQIIAISPIREVADGWAGLGGGTYRGIHFCQINYQSGSDYPGNIKHFPDAIFVHEMLHCMESASKKINPDKTPGLHDNAAFGYTDGSDEWRKWYTAYMRSELEGNKGLDPAVYQVNSNSEYLLVSDDMGYQI